MLPLFAVLTLGAGADQLGLLRAVGQAPILVLSLFVGAWVDGWRTRTVMVVADAGRAAGGQLVNVTVMAVRQALTPAGIQGRVAATITCAGMGTTPLGSLLGGFLAQWWGLRTGLLVTAAAMLLSPALMALSPLTRLGRTLPAPAE